MTSQIDREDQAAKQKLFAIVANNEGKTTKEIHARFSPASRYGLDATSRRLGELASAGLLAGPPWHLTSAGRLHLAESLGWSPGSQEGQPDTTTRRDERWYGARILQAIREHGPMTAREIGWRVGLTHSPVVRGYLSGLSKSGLIRRDGVRWTIGAVDAALRAEAASGSEQPIRLHDGPVGPISVAVGSGDWMPPDALPVPLDPQHQIEALKVALERQKEETALAVADACEQAAEARKAAEERDRWKALCDGHVAMIKELVGERDEALREVKRIDRICTMVQAEKNMERKSREEQEKYRVILEKIVEDNANVLASDLLIQIERLCKPSV